MLGQQARAAATRMVRAQLGWQAARTARPDATLRYGTVLDDWRLRIDGYGDAFPPGAYSFLEATCVLPAELYTGETEPGGGDGHRHGLTVPRLPETNPRPGDRVLVAWLNGLTEPCVLGRVTRARPPGAVAVLPAVPGAVP